MDPEAVSRLARRQAMTWLDTRPSELVDYTWLSSFEYEGQRIPLMDPQRGIRKPALMTAALSIRTVFTPPSSEPPYEDAQGPDGLLRYKWRGTDPDHAENRALRRSMQDGLPLIWFMGIAPGQYAPIYPVFVAREESDRHQFVIALDESQRLMASQPQVTEDQRAYSEQINKARLHGPVFRARVLSAYESRCAVCALKRNELLDAAHIIADGKPHGLAIVPNGLALCKIHHAAYDRNIIGIDPSLTVRVRTDILDEIDGPMLRHGIQAMHNQKLRVVPRARSARPEPVRLEERFAEFLLTP